MGMGFACLLMCPRHVEYDLRQSRSSVNICQVQECSHEGDGLTLSVGASFFFFFL